MYKIKFYPTHRGDYPVKDFIQRFQKEDARVTEKEIEQAKKNMEDFILRYRQGEFEL